MRRYIHQDIRKRPAGSRVRSIVRGKFVKWHPAREGFLQIVVTEEA